MLTSSASARAADLTSRFKKTPTDSFEQSKTMIAVSPLTLDRLLSMAYVFLPVALETTVVVI